MIGRSPDVIVKDDEAMWQVAGAGWIYVVSDERRAGKALLTLLVDDLEEHIRRLLMGGVATPAIELAPGHYRKIVINDPDGNSVTLGENLSSET